MSATKAGILLLFKTLGGVPCQSPPGDLKAAQALWHDEAVRRGATDDEMLVAARVLTSGTSPFWPAIGQVIAAIPRFGGEPSDDPDVVWAEVNRARAHHGPDNPPRFNRPKPLRLRNRARDGWETTLWTPPEPPGAWMFDGSEARIIAIRLGLEAAGGWPALQATDPSAVSANRAAFRNAFTAAHTHAQRGAIFSEVRASLIASGTLQVEERVDVGERRRTYEATAIERLRSRSNNIGGSGEDE